MDQLKSEPQVKPSMLFSIPDLPIYGYQDKVVTLLLAGLTAFITDQNLPPIKKMTLHSILPMDQDPFQENGILIQLLSEITS